MIFCSICAASIASGVKVAQPATTPAASIMAAPRALYRANLETKLQHWRAFPAIFWLEAAPVLEFDRRITPAA